MGLIVVRDVANGDAFFIQCDDPHSFECEVRAEDRPTMDEAESQAISEEFKKRCGIWICPDCAKAVEDLSNLDFLLLTGY